MMAAPAIDRSGGMRASVLLLVFLSAYFALQAGLRLASASSLNLDDSEMMVVTQAFAPGYGSQPPLYNWIQILGTEVLGAGAQANVLIHFLLLWSIFVFMFLAAQIVLGDDLKAAVVALALFTIPQISWESQHSHTHAVLSMAVASLTLYVMLLVLKTGRWAAYLGFGVCLALGILSKYNFIVFALALLISAGSIPALRSRILSPRLAVALALAALLVAPHLNWVWDHLPETLSRTNKFKIRGDAGLFEAWGRGLSGQVPVRPACRANQRPRLRERLRARGQTFCGRQFEAQLSGKYRCRARIWSLACAARGPDRAGAPSLGFAHGGAAAAPPGAL